MSQCDEHNQDGLSIAVLLRMAADGELSAEQEAALHEHLEANPGDSRCIEFERKLRDACRCACSPDCCAPAGLRERVMACCCEAELGERLAARAEHTRDRVFWARRTIVRFGAVAALLALVAVMAFMVGRSSGPVSQEVWIQRVANFARKEHGRCAEMPAATNTKFTVHKIAGVEPEFASLAGREVSLGVVLEAEKGGLHFVDAGECHLPGGGTAMHIRFQTDNPADGMVSLWALVDGSLELEEGVTYSAGEGCGCVRIWRVGEVRYVLICSNDERAPEVCQALACPNRSEHHGTP